MTQTKRRSLNWWREPWNLFNCHQLNLDPILANSFSWFHVRVGYLPQCPFSPGLMEEQTKQSLQCDRIESRFLGLEGISGADSRSQCGPSHGQQDRDRICVERWNVEPSTLGRSFTCEDMGSAESDTPVSCLFSSPSEFPSRYFEPQIFGQQRMVPEPVRFSLDL